MKASACLLLSLLVLAANLAWSADGHALTGEHHGGETSFSTQIDDRDDNSAEPVCDHHCHAGAHLVALSANGVSDFVQKRGSLLTHPLARHYFVLRRVSLPSPSS